MFTLEAPAKINWFLSVLNKRQDGYHEIQSLMQSITLYDYLTFKDSEEIEVETESKIPLKDNLVYKTAVFLKEEFKVKKGVSITLKKEIPMAAGLGGGSSDAACAMMGLNKIWELGLDNKKLMALGSMIGSDVPFFFNGNFALAEGRGEVITPISIKTQHVLLLVKPDVGVSTKWAYAEISKLLEELTKKDNNIKLSCQALESRDFRQMALVLRNDFEIPIAKEFPVISDLKIRLLEAGAKVSLMSGSGPTVFGVFDNKAKAEKAAEVMKPNWSRVVETII